MDWPKESLHRCSTCLKVISVCFIRWANREYSRNCLMSSHKDFTVVFVQSTLGVSNSRHILDDHGVIGVFSFLVQNIVCLDHIINNIALANLLASESLLLVQVLAIYKRKSAAIQKRIFKKEMSIPLFPK